METEGRVRRILLPGPGGWGFARMMLRWGYGVARTLTDPEITETDYSQSIFPAGQTSGRGAEDGKIRKYSLLSHMLISFQGKQTGEDGGIVRQTTE